MRTKRALISVFDKSGIVDFAKSLNSMGWEIISTGGTSKKLKEEGLQVKDISDLTQFPECFDGRVKTLHPNVEGGILAIRDNEKHKQQTTPYNPGKKRLSHLMPSITWILPRNPWIFPKLVLHFGTRC